MQSAQSSNSNYRIGKATHSQRTPTCDTCKSRHQKCSGEKPSCSNCTLRKIKCAYTVFATSTRPRVSGDSQSPENSASISRPSISDAEYNALYSEIFSDILRRFNLNKEGASASLPSDVILDARPGSASLSSFDQKVFSIVKEHLANEFGASISTSQSDSDVKEPAPERGGPDHIRKLLRDSLPALDIARHLLQKFLDHQNSIFYVCSKEEAEEQLALIYNSTSFVSISWLCQMYLIFAIGVQYDDVYDTDGATYYDLGQKHIDDAVDENPQSTAWVIRAMLLLCFYQPATKWKSVWMHLDAAIRGAQRFQLDTGRNTSNELSEAEFREYRRLWLTVISFDRWVAIFLGRLPRIKESISKDPIFNDPDYRLEDTPQSTVCALAIISGNILRDMYFLENPSLNMCRQRKNDLENWMSSMKYPLQQVVKSGNIPPSPNDQAEVIFTLHFMHLGAWALATRPFLCKALRMNTTSNFGGPIESVIMSEANLCIGYATRLISSATLLLGSPLAPKRATMPLFYLIHAAYIMILAVVWKSKQNGSLYGSPTQYTQMPELTAVDSAIQILQFCAQRNSFARRYLIQIKELRRQITQTSSTGPSISPAAFPSSSSVAELSQTGESPALQNMATVTETMDRPPPGPRTFTQGSYSDASPMDMNLEDWQFGLSSAGTENSVYDAFDPNVYDANNFWDGVPE